METNIIDLTIEKLAGLGDGASVANGRKIFVPLTVPGDRVRARILKTIDGAAHAVLQEVLSPGPDRIAPVCRHFGECGGCALQHLSSRFYNEFKQQMACEAVRKAGFDPALVSALVTLPAAGRRRVELKVENGEPGYYAAGSHRLVAISECKVLEPELEALVLWLKGRGLAGVTTIQINGVDNGYDVVMEGAATQRLFVNKAGSIGSQPPTLTLGTVKVNVPKGAFLQASRAAQDFMTRWVGEAANGAVNLLDLFAGIGTYSFTLPETLRITAVEADAPMVKAMQAAAPANVKVQQRDLFKLPFNTVMLKAFDCVIINPPRNGAKAQCEELAKSSVPKIILVSCNPATFTRDAKTLREGGYTLTRATPLDQFVYSSHLELLAEFVR